MSGKPHPEGVSEVVRALARCEELRATIAELEPAVTKLQAARTEYSRLSNEIAMALEAMDLVSQGNYGFGGRMGWFLAEMRRQIAAEVERSK